MSLVPAEGGDPWPGGSCIFCRQLYWQVLPPANSLSGRLLQAKGWPFSIVGLFDVHFVLNPSVTLLGDRKDQSPEHLET